MSHMRLRRIGYINDRARDSGWITWGVHEKITLFHNLGTDEVLIYLIGKGEYLDVTGVHQIYYGDIGGYNYGASWWGLNSTHIRIGNNENMIWNQVRVQIWKITQP